MKEEEEQTHNLGIVYAEKLKMAHEQFSYNDNEAFHYARAYVLMLNQGNIKEEWMERYAHATVEGCRKNHTGITLLAYAEGSANELNDQQLTEYINSFEQIYPQARSFGHNHEMATEIVECFSQGFENELVKYYIEARKDDMLPYEANLYALARGKQEMEEDEAKNFVYNFVDTQEKLVEKFEIDEKEAVGYVSPYLALYEEEYERLHTHIYDRIYPKIYNHFEQKAKTRLKDDPEESVACREYAKKMAKFYASNITQNEAHLLAEEIAYNKLYGQILADREIDSFQKNQETELKEGFEAFKEKFLSNLPLEREKADDQ